MGFTNRTLELTSTNQPAKFLDYDRKSGAFEMLCPRASSVDTELTSSINSAKSGRDLAGFVQGLYGLVRGLNKLRGDGPLRPLKPVAGQ